MGRKTRSAPFFWASVELHGEVGVVAVGEGGVADDLQTQLLGLGHEGLVDALGVHVVVLPDNGDLGAQLLLRDVRGRSGTLVGVHEAHLEHIVLALDGSGGRRGGGQRKDAVLVVLPEVASAGLEVTEPRDSCMPQSFRVL